MKHKSIILFMITVILITCSNAYANGSYILPYEKTTYMNIGTNGNSDWEIASSQTSGNVAITKDGTLIMFPYTTTEPLMIKNAVSEYEQSFLNPIHLDFEQDELSNNGIYFNNAEIVNGENNKYIAPTVNNEVSLNFENTKIGSGVLSAEFDAYKPDESAADLFSIEGSDGTLFGQISLQRKSASTVYFAYKSKTGLIPLRNNVISIKQWVHIAVQVDFYNKTISVYANETKMIDNITFLGNNDELFVGKVKFGVNIDNVDLYSGTKCNSSELRLHVPNEIVAKNGIRNAVKCDAEVRLDNTWYYIDGKYLNISISGSNAVTSDDGYFVINGDQLTNDASISVKSSIVISEQIYEAESVINVKKNGEMSGEEYGKYIVDKAIAIQSGSNTIVKASAYNPENEDKNCYVLLGFYDGNQCSNIVLWHWEIPKNSYNVTKEFVLVNSDSSNARVYVLDADSLADIQ